MPKAERLSELAERLEGHAHKVEMNRGFARLESQTRILLIDPFIKGVLGHDLADPTNVEISVDVSHGEAEKKEVDYSIKATDGNNPVHYILVEAKAVETNPCREEFEQLRDYVARCRSARFGLLTNGIDYNWYRCPPKSTILDDVPFLTHCSLKPSEREVEWLQAVSRDRLDRESLERLARRMSLEPKITEWLYETFTDPSQKSARALNNAANLGVERGELSLVQDAAKAVWSRIQSKSQPQCPKPPIPNVNLEIVQEPPPVLADGEVLTPRKQARAWRIGEGDWQRTIDGTELLMDILGKLLMCDTRRNDEKHLASGLDLKSFESPPTERGYRRINGFETLYCFTSVSNAEKRRLLERIARSVKIDSSVRNQITQGDKIECWLPTGGSRNKKNNA